MQRGMKKPVKKFSFGQFVTVTGGFYEGCEGTIKSPVFSLWRFLTTGNGRMYEARIGPRGLNSWRDLREIAPEHLSSKEQKYENAGGSILDGLNEA